MESCLQTVMKVPRGIRAFHHGCCYSGLWQLQQVYAPSKMSRDAFHKQSSKSKSKFEENFEYSSEKEETLDKYLYMELSDRQSIIHHFVSYSVFF